MKKCIFTIVLVFVMGAFVQGCGADGESKASSEPNEAIEISIPAEKETEETEAPAEAVETAEPEETEKTEKPEGEETGAPEQTQAADSGESAGEITEDMAYEAVSNYCHKEYDWNEFRYNQSFKEKK